MRLHARQKCAITSKVLFTVQGLHWNARGYMQSVVKTWLRTFHTVYMLK